MPNKELKRYFINNGLMGIITIIVKLNVKD
jgi:hypothetical protein